MTALTKNRDIARFGQRTLVFPNGVPVKGSTTIYQGALVVADSGYARPARTTAATTTDVLLGVAEEFVKNDSTTDGKATCHIVAQGMYSFANSTGTDAIVQTDLGKTVYAVDDQTAAKTNNTNKRVALGKFVGFDGQLVIVAIG